MGELKLANYRREQLERLTADPALPWTISDGGGWDANGQLVMECVEGATPPTITDFVLYIQELQQKVENLEEAVREERDDRDRNCHE